MDHKWIVTVHWRLVYLVYCKPYYSFCLSVASQPVRIGCGGTRASFTHDDELSSATSVESPRPVNALSRDDTSRSSLVILYFPRYLFFHFTITSRDEFPISPWCSFSLVIEAALLGCLFGFSRIELFIISGRSILKSQTNLHILPRQK